jgi:transitional endoplasmic reticulum ATPase
MADPSCDTFSLVSHDSGQDATSKNVFSEYTDHFSSQSSDLDTWFTSILRSHHPGLTLTVTPTPLIAYASLGFAKVELDTTDSSVLRWRFYLPAYRRGMAGSLGDAEFFAKYKYLWMAEEFIVYAISLGYSTLYYVLKEPDKERGEDVRSHCAKTDLLILTIGEYADTLHHEILVYDGYWQKSAALWEEVQKASWDDVILDDEMKKTLTTTVERFFDSKETYKDLDVPWKVHSVLFPLSPQHH